MACPCFAREGTTEPFRTRGHGGTGLQFLNWSCRRQPCHRLAASPLSLHPKGGPRSIYPLLRERCAADLGRCLPRLTPRRVILLAPVRALGASWPRPVQLDGLCEWMPNALEMELGTRTVASQSCAVPTCHAVPASGLRCRRQPAPGTPPSSSVTPR